MNIYSTSLPATDACPTALKPLLVAGLAHVLNPTQINAYAAKKSLQAFLDQHHDTAMAEDVIFQQLMKTAKTHRNNGHTAPAITVLNLLLNLAPQHPQVAAIDALRGELKPSLQHEDHTPRHALSDYRKRAGQHTTPHPTRFTTVNQFLAERLGVTPDTDENDKKPTLHQLR